MRCNELWAKADKRRVRPRGRHAPADRSERGLRDVRPPAARDVLVAGRVHTAGRRSAQTCRFPLDVAPWTLCLHLAAEQWERVCLQSSNNLNLLPLRESVCEHT